MIIAHLSDFRLGHRAFAREVGREFRSRDVAGALDLAVDRVVELEPALVLITGDVFDSPSPDVEAIEALIQGMEHLSEGLEGAPVVMAAGIRDRRYDIEGSGLLSTFSNLFSIETATGEVHEVRLPDLEARVVLVPGGADSVSGDLLEPDPSIRWNLLLAYGQVDYGEGRSIEASKWSYVGLGSAGEYRRHGPNAFSPGPLERLGEVPWEGVSEERGFLSYDLESATSRFHRIPGRPVVSLAAIKNRERDAEWIGRRVQEVVRELPGGIDGKLVRLRLDGFGSQQLVDIEPQILSSIRKQAGHLSVDLCSETSPRWSSVPEAVAQVVEADDLKKRVTSALQGINKTAAPSVEFSEVRGPPLSALRGLRFEVPTGLTVIRCEDMWGRREFGDLLLQNIENEDEHTGPLRRLFEPEADSSIDQMFHGVLDILEALSGIRDLDDLLGHRQLDVGPDSGTPGSGSDRSANQLERTRKEASTVAGELEAATMEWLREREDAEIQLQNHRDRARELKRRLDQVRASGEELPCPTCGRVLDGHYARVIETLRDEWESVVQDGQWWRRRREQLETRPDRVRELESSSSRLDATVERLAERTDLVAVGSADSAGDGIDSDEHDLPEGVRRALTAVLEHRRESLCSLLLHHWSVEYRRLLGGRVATFVDREGICFFDEGRWTRVLRGEERSIGSLALLFAAVMVLAEVDGLHLDALLLGSVLETLPTELMERVTRRARAFLPGISRVVMVSGGDWLWRIPEVPDRIYELREDSDGIFSLSDLSDPIPVYSISK